MTVEAVAIRWKGEVHSLPKPNRHHDVIRMLFECFGESVHADEDDQGFLRHDGVFMMRRPALLEAQKCNQLLPGAMHYGGKLYSEDVW